MKKMRWSVLLVALVLMGLLFAVSANRSSTARAESQATHIQPQPVEKDMHEFMEYVFEPTYKRLKQSMSREPADNNAWKGVKSDALILAEGGNLLMFRGSKKGTAAWGELSAAVRDSGSKLYQAAKQKDYRSTREHYEAMLQNCNSCHKKFAEGKHQVSP